MKKLIWLLLVAPLFSFGQKIPDYGFNKIRLTDGDKIIQAEVLPVSSNPSLDLNLLYYWYRANEIHTTQGGFSGKLLNGSYTEYYLDKNLKEQGAFKKGLKDGEWKAWNDNGTLTELYTWDNGVRSGRFELFDAEGKVKESGRYRDGVLVIPNKTPFLKRINIFKKKNKDTTLQKK